MAVDYRVSTPVSRVRALRILGGAAVATALSPSVSRAASAEVTPILGCPTDRSATLHVHADRAVDVFVERLGSNVGTNRQTPTRVARPEAPAVFSIDDLDRGVRYGYQVWVRAEGSGDDFALGPEGAIQTARRPDEAFTFTVQGDSHPERQGKQFDPTLYARTLDAIGADHPDFHLMLGDDFSVDALKVVNAMSVNGRYTLQIPFLGRIAHSIPLYLVNGNHEQAARYLLDGTPNNVAVWAQVSRNRAFPQPAPDHFYTGNHEVVPHIGLLRNYFAWTWGDALFVTLDPYWGSDVAVDNVFQGTSKRADLWDSTLGETQYRWFREVLEASRARWKFVFAHHVNGTGRGGAAIADRYEWGGRNARGVWEFDRRRPGWRLPIHQLMAAHGVTVFFQGHDHLYAYEQLDGVIYQTVPEPADPNSMLWNDDAYPGAVIHSNSGYLRVHVAPNAIHVEYVKSYLAQDALANRPDGTPRVHGEVAHDYVVTATTASPSASLPRHGAA